MLLCHIPSSPSCGLTQLLFPPQALDMHFWTYQFTFCHEALQAVCGFPSPFPLLFRSLIGHFTFKWGYIIVISLPNVTPLALLWTLEKWRIFLHEGLPYWYAFLSFAYVTSEIRICIMINDILEEMWNRIVQFVIIWFALLCERIIGQIFNILSIISLVCLFFSVTKVGKS